MSLHQATPPDPDDVFTDRHLVETPEQVQLHFALAGIGSRFLALAIDTLIQAGVGFILGFLLFFVAQTGFSRVWGATSLWLTGALIAFVFLLQFGYFALFEVLWGGQTPGKRIIGIRAIKDTGRPLSPTEVIGRNLLRIVDQMPGFYAVAIVTAMFNAQSKRLGDFVAGSIVIGEKSLNELHHSWGSAPPSMAQPLLPNQRLTSEELALIETFLTRRSDLAPGVRNGMAQQILGRLEPKLSLTEDHRTRVETTLEYLAHEYRSRDRYSE